MTVDPTNGDMTVVHIPYMPSTTVPATTGSIRVGETKQFIENELIDGRFKVVEETPRREIDMAMVQGVYDGEYRLDPSIIIAAIQALSKSDALSTHAHSAGKQVREFLYALITK